MSKMDFNNAIAITRDIYWVGFNEEGSNLRCNPYLLIDGEDIILFDPGSLTHFPVVMRKVIDLVNPEHITAAVASHQDPDICSNLPVLEDVVAHGNLKVIAHINTIRLIRHYGVRSQFYDVAENDYKMVLKSGRVLEFIFTPYLHSPGAITTLDHKTHTLFSSDIFGAISDEWDLFANQGFPENMDAFHQAYMPSNKNLKQCMEKLEKYNIERILPQHGSVIEGDNVQIAMDHLKQLPCGVDLMED
ncbi:MAG: MBL fold metallo-hydrolase [Nitrospina sp.]|jgi:flavorubredoxin|nr:MBL fold metallo-hydrolase [Nitrospina sp.]MBT6716092.1 MBL fold metallo-hydrolase [Nitrospina sp.]